MHTNTELACEVSLLPVPSTAQAMKSPVEERREMAFHALQLWVPCQCVSQEMAKVASIDTAHYCIPPDLQSAGQHTV